MKLLHIILVKFSVLFLTFDAPLFFFILQLDLRRLQYSKISKVSDYKLSKWKQSTVPSVKVRLEKKTLAVL